MDDHVTWADKGFMEPGEAVDLTTYATSGRNLFDGSFTWPVMVLKKSALEHNIATLAGFTEEHGLLLAPHGKTTMAPSLYQRQLDAGAWAITVASPSQALVARHAGVRRVLVANEILDHSALSWVASERAADPEFLHLHWVDSVEGVEAAAEASALVGVEDRPLAVLIDLGFPGGRTGCRSVGEAVELARVVDSTPGVLLAGVAGYEGGLGTAEAVGDYFDRLKELASTLFTEGLVPADAIVSAGGSAFFDVLAERWSAGWPDGMTPRKVLRSGTYVTHDHGLYADTTPYNRIEGTLDPAIEVWAQVVSAPEEGLVIVGMGRRDVPYDNGLPTPLTVRRNGFGGAEKLEGTVEKLADQHAFLRTDAGLRPGDLVSFGISHPCTAFDKWRLIPVVDLDYTVTDLVRTYF
ncbi:alanine racemase [Nocardioides luteus]|uniref:alanine racemase n=1 Tax=Nocardioides luteus TaxID=1844 RepID=UPI0018CABB73|nr:alanine racemase [Nocardioides luteus]MBG6099567.1 D-serine deaminase-like pyridoxal phosphate-dependent protein [Nocardioides luteus]